MLERIDYLEKKGRIMLGRIYYIEQSTLLIDW